MNIKKFYKVIVLAIDLFESRIIDERHFESSESATKFIESLNNTDYIGVMVEV